jgi:hypothetical protein
LMLLIPIGVTFQVVVPYAVPDGPERFFSWSAVG